MFMSVLLGVILGTDQELVDTQSQMDYGVSMNIKQSNTPTFYKSRIEAMRREIKKAENLIRLQKLVASTEERLDSLRQQVRRNS
jgi:hypothetical protein